MQLLIETCRLPISLEEGLTFAEQKEREYLEKA